MAIIHNQDSIFCSISKIGRKKKTLVSPNVSIFDIVEKIGVCFEIFRI